MTTIHLKSIRFSETPFRKLGTIAFDLAPRLTLIAGRNGVGKSTILALIANASGITRGARAYTTYFGKLPQGNLHEIIHLSVEHEFVAKEQDKPNVFLTYQVNDVEVVKKCNISRRANDGLRIVPRNEPKGKLQAGNLSIAADGKLPLPTIYLGMVRMMPVGEADPGTLQSLPAKSMSPQDAIFIDSFTKRIIQTGANQANPDITQQWVKGTPKNSMHPPYSGYDSKAVSLGQDSLSAIATALASFQKLKDTMKAKYPGGLLVIDEVDAGFHPLAQQKLFNELKVEADRLNLQIVATTHSLIMISEAHQSITEIPVAANRKDAIVYLQGSNPIQLLDASNYDAIESDMFLKLRALEKQREVKVYVEDSEAELFLKAILTRSRMNKIKQETGVKVKILSCHLGCETLMKLYSADDHFKTVVVVVDGDMTPSKKVTQAKNVLRLPNDPLITVKQAPEPLIEAMCKLLVSDAGAYPETRKRLQKNSYSTEHVQNLILDLQGNKTASTFTVAGDREFAKAWFTRRLNSILSLELIDGWVADNSTAVDDFVKKFTAAIAFADSARNVTK